MIDKFLIAIAWKRVLENHSKYDYQFAFFSFLFVSLWPQIVLAESPFPEGSPATVSTQEYAQDPDPNRDRFLQDTPLPEPLPEEEEEESETPQTPEVRPNGSDGETIAVEQLVVSGSTIFSEEDLASLIQPYLEDRRVSREDLQEIADGITKLYLERGYITSRAILVEDSIATGKIRIQVLEGSLEKIEIEGTQRLRQSYIRKRLELGTGTPLNTNDLENQLRLLRADPLLENVEANLRTGSSPTETILVVRVQEANPWGGSFGVDNYSPPSVGSERLVLSLSNINLTGLGDQLAINFAHTTRSGADSLDFSYRLPVNAKNGTVQLRASFNRNEVVQEPFAVLGISGESQLYEVSYRQPIVRTPREELAFSLGFAYQDGQTFTFAGPTPFGLGPSTEGITTTSVFKLGQDYLLRQPSGSWAFRSQFSFGTTLFGATENSGERIPDGQFISWLGQIQRVQVLNEDNFLIGSLDVQLTNDGLLSSQQFVIGGGQSVRGYRQNVRAGDAGVRFSLEHRLTLERNEAGIPTFQLTPFVDLGWVWNTEANRNPLPDETFIVGVGVGIIWTPLPNLNLRFDYGFPLMDLDDRGENAQDDGIHFRVNYEF